MSYKLQVPFLTNQEAKVVAMHQGETSPLAIGNLVKLKLKTPQVTTSGRFMHNTEQLSFLG